MNHLPFSEVSVGRPSPLGATLDANGVNFALFSAHADRVELCLFDSSGKHELQRVELRARTNDIWHGYLPQARADLLYGYRVHGRYRPQEGHRFNAHKLLVDPYAKSLAGEIEWSDAHFGYRIGQSTADLSLDQRDNARLMPKCRVIDPAYNWEDDRPPRTPWKDTVIYELHVKGFTIAHPSVPPELRGTYAGLASAPVIEHLKRIGVTAVELLPIHAFAQDRHLVERGLRNFWGYNSLAFLTPQPSYCATGSISEFKTMVKALHAAGIEVILDVVYNHTAEGNQMGPTLSMRGIDNASYYRLVTGNARYYMDYTGCGNTLDTSNSHVLELIRDSLRYWVEDMHVDGFRFDLGVALTRDMTGVEMRGAFLQEIARDPVLSQVKMIAEPWDLGPGGYQLGCFPAGWGEWN
ncbi:MAG TPA: glycogen debranching protein GlgX, partial [Rhodoferax sp.]|nr:glycogen debranching protein GlgX [Rhodoferax sp.]